jgi:hypothetical protein
MLTFYRKTYKRAAKGAEHLNPFEIGVLYPRTDGAAETNGNGAGMTVAPERPAELPAQPAGPMKAAAEPAAIGAPAGDDEKARKRAESQERAALMAQLSPEVKLRVAKKELALVEALTEAGLEVPESLRTGASAPAPAPVAPGEVEISATGADPKTQEQPGDLAAQAVETVAETPADPKEAKRAEAQRKLALMQRLPSELKLRVAKREISLEDALREAGVDPETSV